ncbi:hypothetical protein [Pedobacter boryungensis]|uniref:Uncharacterized protein n=1 Tax=Pedobacter boryungensis TaxID=869962 RepID=A0ABX2DDV1_9SPHI|nr:hypothetical protein [Pedobacter boryungensis]NQX32278.1 hypothetical protein [Pedobacter boryungensis]
MIELIAHDLVKHDALKKWIVFTNEDVVNNYEAVFGEQGVHNLNIAINKLQRDFYEIKRYYQFVGIIKYNHINNMLTMNLFESDDMDNFLDGVLSLKDQNWKSDDISKIGEITHQILDNQTENLARIRIKKLI